MLTLLTTTGVTAAIDSTTRALGPLLLGQDYVVTATAPAWIQQGTNQRIACVPTASLTAGDHITVGVAPDGIKIYELDVTGRGVGPDHVGVNVSSDVTAAQVAARLASVIKANHPALALTVSGDGTIDVRMFDAVVTIVAEVASAAFSVTDLVMPVSVGNGSTLVPAGAFPVVVNGAQGAQIGVIQDGTATGRACLARCLRS